jgi:hypothetical protein
MEYSVIVWNIRTGHYAAYPVIKYGACRSTLYELTTAYVYAAPLIDWHGNTLMGGCDAAIAYGSHLMVHNCII